MSFALPRWTVVGFTGHRKLEDPDRAAAAIARALDDLQARAGPLAGISSAAAGADTLLCAPR